MKDIIIGGGACVFVGLGVFFAPPFQFGSTQIIDTSKGPVISGSNDQIASMLMNSSVDQNANFKLSKMEKTRSADDTVSFSFKDKIELINCTAKIERIDDSRAQVVTACKPSEGLKLTGEATGLKQNSGLIGLSNDLVNFGFREFVDATIEDRPFNDRKIKVRAAAQLARHNKELRADMQRLESQWGENGVGDPNDPKMQAAICDAYYKGGFKDLPDQRELQDMCGTV